MQPPRRRRGSRWLTRRASLAARGAAVVLLASALAVGGDGVRSISGSRVEALATALARRRRPRDAAGASICRRDGASLHDSRRRRTRFDPRPGRSDSDDPIADRVARGVGLPRLLRRGRPRRPAGAGSACSPGRTLIRRPRARDADAAASARRRSATRVSWRRGGAAARSGRRRAGRRAPARRESSREPDSRRAPTQAADRGGRGDGRAGRATRAPTPCWRRSATARRARGARACRSRRCSSTARRRSSSASSGCRC